MAALKAAVGIGGVLSAIGLLTLLSSLLLLRIPRLASRKQFVVDAQ